MNLRSLNLSSLARLSPALNSRPTASPRPASIQGGWQTFPRVPEINPANPSSIQAYTRAIAARVTGSAENRSTITQNGQNPWSNGDGRMNERITVGWALQQHPKVKYDADRKMFFVQNARGQVQDVASLDELRGVIDRAGGVRSDNGAAMQGVRGFLAGRIPKRGSVAELAATQIWDSAATHISRPESAPSSASPAPAKKAKKGLLGRIGGMFKKLLGGGKGLFGGLLSKVLGGAGGLLGKLGQGGFGGFMAMIIPAPLRALVPMLSGRMR